MIILSCDHGAFEVMQKLMAEFKNQRIEFKYVGPSEYDPKDDYPDFAIRGCEEVLKSKTNVGIFMCGSGVGVSMVANRHKGVRAVCANDENLARLSRLHNDANVLTLGARIVSFRKMKKIIKVFLETKFEGGRHTKRLAKF